MKKWMKRVVLPIAIVGGGIAVASGLGTLQPESEPREVTAKRRVVEVRELQPDTIDARIEASGTVLPSRRVVASPEVTGRLVWMSDELVPGGRFEKGALMARIDPRDLRLAVAQERSRLESAELELALERGRQDVARREWSLLGDDANAQRKELALRTPHLRAAEAALEAARSSVARAELNLSRTEIRAPFNALVLAEAAEIGQLVGPQTQLATLVGSDTFWVRAQVPVEELSSLEIPGYGGSSGSKVDVIQELGKGEAQRWEGRIVRLEGEIDPQTRTAQVLVEVAEPLDSGKRLPLLPGAFVHLEVEGRALPDVYEVPRSALHEGGHVWIVDGEGKLARREVDILWSTVDAVLARGLEPGVQVVTSPLSIPVEGAPVEVLEGEATS